MSPELLLSSHSYLNPLSDRELDLRGYQIPAIENLGVTKVCHLSFFVVVVVKTTYRMAILRSGFCLIDNLPLIMDCM